MVKLKSSKSISTSTTETYGTSVATKEDNPAPPPPKDRCPRCKQGIFVVTLLEVGTRANLDYPHNRVHIQCPTCRSYCYLKESELDALGIERIGRYLTGGFSGTIHLNGKGLKRPEEIYP